MTSIAASFAERELSKPTRWMQVRRQARRNPTLIVGIIIGSLSGYYGGKIDTLFMRII